MGNANCPTFTYGNNTLEIVDKYKYLGMIITKNGNINKMIEDRISKARKAIFLIKRALSTSCNVSPKLALSIFDKKIAPILLYGCPIWGIRPRKEQISIKLQTITGNAKEGIMECFKTIGSTIKSDDFQVIRVYRDKGEAIVKINKMTCKIELLAKYQKRPVTFIIQEHVIADKNDIEKTHTNFCKFTLGISKYESNTLVLGELGRYPIEFKAIRQCLLYWLRLEQSTDNVLLNKAFNDCKNLNHDWINNIYNFLCSNGLRHIWENIKQLDKNYVKHKIIQRLNDQYLQKYNDYVKQSNTDKSFVIEKCVENEMYNMRNYISIVRSPLVRNILTRLRIDCNKLQDSKFRHFRFKSTTSDMCPDCLMKDSVSHLLFHCQQQKIMSIRKGFYDWYYKENSAHFDLLPENQKIKFLLNVEGDSETICSFIKRIYLNHE